MTLSGKKTNTPRVHHLGEAALELLPVRRPGELIFWGRRAGKPATRQSVLKVLETALDALGLDGRALDVHSFRRTWVSDAERAPGVPRALAMRLTGHKTLAVYMAYEANTEGDDLRQAADGVRAYRAARSSQGSSHTMGGDPANSASNGPKEPKRRRRVRSPASGA